MKTNVLLAAALAVVTALWWSGCAETSPVALGQYWEVFVVADDQDWEAVGELIQETLEKPLATPLAEKEYVVQRVKPEEFEQHLTMRNLLIVSSLTPGTETERLLRRALDDDTYDKIAAGEEYLFVARDQWARGQFLVILAAPGAEALTKSVAFYPDYLYALFERNRNQKLRELLFARTYGRIERRLKEDYGWTIKLPFGYKVVRQDSANRVVHISKLNPDRNILVHWVEAAEQVPLSRDWMVEKVNWLASFYESGYVKEGEFFISTRRWHNYDALVMFGLWQSDTRQIGGPMQAYAFRDRQSGRLYVIFGNVFAPDRRKEPYVRELETIIDTFKSFAPAGAKATS